MGGRRAEDLSGQGGGMGERRAEDLSGQGGGREVDREVSWWAGDAVRRSSEVEGSKAAGQEGSKVVRR